MNERERPQDDDQDTPNVYEPHPGQPGEGDDSEIDDIGAAMPGADRMSESTEDPTSSDPDLRPDGPAPLP